MLFTEAEIIANCNEQPEACGKEQKYLEFVDEFDDLPSDAPL